MFIEKVNEYFLKARKLNTDLSPCVKVSKFRGELGCSNPHTELSAGVITDALGNIEELRVNFKFANRYLCAFLARANDLLIGSSIYGTRTNKIVANTIRFFGIKKESEEVKALREIVDGLV